MTTHERERGRVRLYSCGGGGINIGHKVERALAKDVDDAFAELDVVYIDTSRSNLRSTISDERVYLIGKSDGSELDGAGQERLANKKAISDRILDILLHFKPVDLNIVLSTGGGGSGSVIGPALVSTLLAKDAPTVVICIGDDSTTRFASNTLSTLQEYEAIAAERQVPPIVSYLQNSPTMTRADVNTRVQRLISSLSLLYSRQNNELDSKDLYHWLHYHKVTSYKPKLTALTLVEELNPASLAVLGNLISIATVASEDHDTRLPIRPDVQYIGYVEEDVAERLELENPRHYVTSDGVFADVMKGLKQVLSDAAEQSSARLAAGGTSGSAG